MPQDKEDEIRLMFLEEATEYLNVIESAMLGAATSLINKDDVLRAAHSIKGGAAMMGFQTLSDLAHRLEDFFKVLKTQQPPRETELESLLLGVIAHMRQVIALNHQGAVLDDEWLEQNVNPVFEQLHQGFDSSIEDSATLLEERQNTVAMLFETEVEECLQRLESVLAEPKQHCLFEEILTMTQELGGLGEMLELPAFSSLCESIIQHLDANPEQIEEITRLALQEWRRSQAALLVGQVDTLPEKIDLSNLEDASRDEFGRDGIAPVPKSFLKLHLERLCNLVKSLTYWGRSIQHSKTTVLQGQKDIILIVDDSISVRSFLSLTLEKAGYRVEQAKDGQDALDKILSGLQVRAVICDIDMPCLDGYGFLARIKSNPAFKQLPIAMLTSRSEDKDRQLAISLGATAYFSKPYNEQELLKALEELI